MNNLCKKKHQNISWSPLKTRDITTEPLFLSHSENLQLVLSLKLLIFGHYFTFKVILEFKTTPFLGITPPPTWIFFIEILIFLALKVTFLRKVSRCLAFSRRWVDNHFYMAKWTIIYTTVQYTELHNTALNYTRLHYTKLYYTTQN